MDIVTLSFYAIVCGVLGLASPKLGTPVIRLAVGAVTGIVAATVLPMVTGLLGGY